MRSLLRVVLRLLLLFLCTAPAFAADWVYTMQPGDTVWGVSRKYLTDLQQWDQVREHNGIKRGVDIRPGTRLRIPVQLLKQAPGFAEVRTVEGQPQLHHPSGALEQLSTGLHLTDGDEVVTATRGRVLLRLQDGSTVQLGTDTAVRIVRLVHWLDTPLIAVELALEHGEIDAHILPFGDNPSSFGVQLGRQRIDASGGYLRLRRLPGRPMQVEVVRGQAKLSGPDGPLALSTGVGAVFAVDGALREHRALPPTPDMPRYPNAFRTLPVTLNWPAASGDGGYRLQVFGADNGGHLVLDQQASGTRSPPLTLADGDYTVVLRAVDPDGMEGNDVVRRIEVSTALDAPALQEPAEGADLVSAPVSFRWLPTGVRHFHLQVANTPDFVTPLLDRPDIDGTEYHSDSALSPGIYYWRVAALGGNGSEGAYSQAASFKVHSALGAPSGLKVSREGDSFRIHWDSLAGTQAYRVQTSTHPGFDLALKQSRVAGTEWLFNRPDVGEYYVRVAGIDTNGDLGAYSKGEPIKVETGMGWKLPALLFALVLLIY